MVDFLILKNQLLLNLSEIDLIKIIIIYEFRICYKSSQTLISLDIIQVRWLSRCHWVHMVQRHIWSTWRRTKVRWGLGWGHECPGIAWWHPIVHNRMWWEIWKTGSYWFMGRAPDISTTACIPAGWWWNWLWKILSDWRGFGLGFWLLFPFGLLSGFSPSIFEPYLASVNERG